MRVLLSGQIFFTLGLMAVFRTLYICSLLDVITELVPVPVGTGSVDFLKFSLRLSDCRECIVCSPLFIYFMHLPLGNYKRFKNTKAISHPVFRWWPFHTERFNFLHSIFEALPWFLWPSSIGISSHFGHNNPSECYDIIKMLHISSVKTWFTLWFTCWFLFCLGRAN